LHEKEDEVALVRCSCAFFIASAVSRASNTIARAGKHAIKLTEKAVAAVKTKVTKK
jgi:hypothetical protein